MGPVDWCGATPADKLVAVAQTHQPQVSQSGPAASVRRKTEPPKPERHM